MSEVPWGARAWEAPSAGQGGTVAGSGGAAAGSGGAASGAAGQGGMAAGQGGMAAGNGGSGAGKGGMAGVAGMPAGGMGGASAGAGGSGGAVPGCGKSSFPKSARYTIESGGMMREYVIDVPANYDSDTKYRLFFTWHWRGGNANNVAPMAGAAFSGCESGSAPVAFWGSHAPGDSVVGIAQGRSARDTFVQRNGCDMQTMATTPSGCVSYQGCDTGYPVTWCEFTGDHYTPDFAPQATWAFFSQF